MDRYEYRVMPAPTKAKRGAYMRGAAQRFADRLEQIFNDMGNEGWEYVRTDTLPNEQRSGMTSTTITYRNMLVFRRVIADVVAPQIEHQAQEAPKALEAPEPIAALEAPKEPAFLDTPNEDVSDLPLASQEQIDATLKLDPFARAEAHETAPQMGTALSEYPAEKPRLLS